MVHIYFMEVTNTLPAGCVIDAIDDYSFSWSNNRD